MNKYIKKLADIITKIPDSKTAEKFLKDILTPNELDDIALRWQIVKRLSKNENQRDIAKKLNVSICKITRGSKELKYGNGGFKKMLNK